MTMPPDVTGARERSSRRWKRRRLTAPNKVHRTPLSQHAGTIHGATISRAQQIYL